MKILRISSAQVKIHQILVILKQQISFSLNFASLFSIIRKKLSTEILYTLSKRTYQSTNLVKFHVSSRKSEILDFDGFLLPKSFQKFQLK